MGVGNKGTSSTASVSGRWHWLDEQNLAKAVLDNVSALIVVLDGEGRIRGFNHAAEQLSGLSFSEVVGKFPWETYLSPDETDTVRDKIIKSLSHHRNTLRWRHSNTWQNKNGERYLTEWSNSIMLDKNGETEFLIGVGMDITERKRAEEALRESEERFWVLFENAPEAIVVLDADSLRFIDVNQNACHLFKMEHEALLKCGPIDVSPPTQPNGRSSAQAAIEMIRRALAGFTQHFEWTHRDATGKEFPCQVHLSHLPSTQGNWLRGSVIDLSERKLAEQKLIESEKLHRAMIEASPDAVAMTDEHGVLTFASPALVEMLKANSADEILDTFVRDWVMHEDRRRAMINIQRRLAGDEMSANEYRLVRKDGAWFHAEVNVSVLWDNYGHPTGMVAFIRDVSERKRAEKQQADLARMVEESLNEICIFDQDTLKFIKINRAARNNLGYTQDEFEQFTPLDIEPELTAEFLAQQLEPLKTGDSREMVFESVHQRKDGTRYPVEVHLQTGTYLGRAVFIALVNDITERKHAESERLNLEHQMQHAQKLESLGVLAGGIAHDFNNLLTSILGFSDLALKSLNEESIAAGYIDHAITGAKKAAELAQQMLAYSGKGRFDVRPLDITELVRDMAGLLEVSISKKCRMQYKLAPGLPVFKADAAQIRQVVMNLIINASEAIGDQPGIITVSTGETHYNENEVLENFAGQNLGAGHYLYLEVSDTGGGMSKETLDKIFEPFFSTKFTGRGLGLSAVQGIIQGHGGGIRVYSETGKGTSFKILLPASVQITIPALETDQYECVDWSASGTVLVIDDETAIRNLVKQMLETMGFSVITAPDGEMGVKKYRQRAEDISLVIVDMTMPKMDGEEVYNEIRKINADARIILSSGYNEQITVDRFAGGGLSGFIQKPYRYDDLVGAIRKALGP